ncbi:hypothetical protein AKJ16_DCAP14791 [Drosera capensis]
MAVRSGIELANALQAQKLWIESDCQQIVAMMKIQEIESLAVALAQQTTPFHSFSSLLLHRPSLPSPPPPPFPLRQQSAVPDPTSGCCFQGL